MNALSNKIRLLLAGITALILAVSYLVIADTGEPQKMIYVEGFAKGAATEIRVNDIPAGNILATKQMFAKALDRHLIPGKNTVTLLPQAENGAAAIRISEYPVGVFVDGKGGEEIGRTQTANGQQTAISFNLDENRPHWQWQTADKLSSAKDMQLAQAFVKKAYACLAEGNGDCFVPLLEPVFHDLSEHDPSVSVKTRVEEFKSKMAKHKADPIWQFTKLDQLQLELIPAADGKLLEVLRKDGSPVFRSSQENSLERITYYNFIGRKNGHWGFYF